MNIYLQSIFSFLFVLGLVLLLYVAFLRLRGALPWGQVGRTLQVVERVALGDKRSLLLVEIGEERLLLGSTSSRVSLLLRLDKSIEAPLEEAPPSTLSPRAESPAFSGIFRQLARLDRAGTATLFAFPRVGSSSPARTPGSHSEECS